MHTLGLRRTCRLRCLLPPPSTFWPLVPWAILFPRQCRSLRVVFTPTHNPVITVFFQVLTPLITGTLGQECHAVKSLRLRLLLIPRGPPFPSTKMMAGTEVIASAVP